MNSITQRASRLVDQFIMPYSHGYDYQTCASSSELPDLTLDAIINRENLVRVFKKCRDHSGPAPGIDGYSFGHYSVTEFGDAADVAVESIRTGRWRPRPSRKCWFPKDGGSMRQIDIRCIPDRVISSAIAEVVTATIDPSLSAGCYGFRPKRGIRGLFAEIAYRAAAEQLTVIAQDDIKNAFPSIIIEHAVEDYSRYVENPDLLRLTEVVLKGHDQSRQVGTDQGDPLSPPTLNLRLERAVNPPAAMPTDSGTLHRYRYADNFVYQCRSVSEGQRALQYDHSLLQQNGFRFKGVDNYPVDLRRRGSSIELLGFTLRLGANGIEFDLGRKAYRNLARALEKAHEGHYPCDTAKGVVRGWIAAYGPAFESGDVPRILDRVSGIAASKGFREIGSREQLLEVIEKRLQQWSAFKGNTPQRLQLGDGSNRLHSEDVPNSTVLQGAPPPCSSPPW